MKQLSNTVIVLSVASFNFQERMSNGMKQISKNSAEVVVNFTVNGLKKEEKIFVTKGYKETAIGYTSDSVINSLQKVGFVFDSSLVIDRFNTEYIALDEIEKKGARLRSATYYGQSHAKALALNLKTMKLPTDSVMSINRTDEEEYISNTRYGYIHIGVEISLIDKIESTAKHSKVTFSIECTPEKFIVFQGGVKLAVKRISQTEDNYKKKIDLVVSTIQELTQDASHRNLSRLQDQIRENEKNLLIKNETGFPIVEYGMSIRDHKNRYTQVKVKALVVKHSTEVNSYSSKENPSYCHKVLGIQFKETTSKDKTFMTIEKVFGYVSPKGLKQIAEILKKEGQATDNYDVFTR